ncbi:MAG: replication initiation protein [Candidatus Thiodiazotropha endolucinida]|nr:replication initiation protein [Candidatus Thiodiazotropha endolucinida]MCW4268289.1 replication initiation protein [Candidatus Thiodiazotropha endolucinida]MCW4331627.1 replication initiation protein [Candidatus Thiodiazotropha endolucinida]MCW4347647.1 replication initiation protein [Candidatus Thiodiazotropha endolucinida]
MKRFDECLVLHPRLNAEGQWEVVYREPGERGPHKVCKSNMLIEAHYKLTFVELRVVLLGVAQLNPREPVPDEIEITAAEYAEAYDTPRNDVYKAFDHAATRLPDRTLKVFDKAGTGKRISWLKLNTTDAEICPKGYGAFYLCFSDEVKAYLAGLSRCFTVYELEKIAPLKSYYSMRLYEQLCQWRSTGKLVVSLKDFRGRLGLEGKYPKFYSLKDDVIDPAIKELSEKSGLRISWEAKRRNNKVVGLTFNFKEKSLKGSKLARFTNS